MSYYVADIIGKVENFLNKLFDDTLKYFENDFSSQTAVNKAKLQNLVIKLPKDNELFVDIDEDFSAELFVHRLEYVSHYYKVEATDETPSKSGWPKRHIVVTLDEKVTPGERIFLQLYLGSDPTREFLGMQRIKSNDPMPTLFLERPPVAVDADIPF